MKFAKKLKSFCGTIFFPKNPSKMHRCNLLIFLSLILWTKHTQTLENGLGRTPSMGLIAWGGYDCNPNCNPQSNDCISEHMIVDAADLMVSEGYKDAGYEYIIIDGCWHNNVKSNITNELIPSLKRFPNGIKYLADYVHSKGLKFGLYHLVDVNHTDYEKDLKPDAQTFAKWGVDYMKFNFLSDASKMLKVYRNFGQLLNETGQPIVYACSWPFYQRLARDKINFEILKNTCNSWRNEDNILNSYESLRRIIDQSGDIQEVFQPHAGPGHFNNPDMLMIGNSGLSIDQSRTQMAIWAILAAPLLMSHRLKYMAPEFKEILLNKQIIAVNQDPIGIQGRRVFSDAKNEVWIRPIQPVYNGSYSFAVAISSKHDGWLPYTVSVNLTHIELNHPHGYYVVDLFDGKTSEFQTNGKNFSTIVKPTGTAFFKFTPIRVDDIVSKPSELKFTNTHMLLWIFVTICLVSLGVGVTYAYVKMKFSNMEYDEHFASFRSRLIFWN